MLKYLGGLVLVLGLAFVVARHNEYATLQSAQESADKNKPAVAVEANKNHPRENPKQSAWDSPSGRIFRAAFGWPEGVTVWAIILTLMAIAEQTGQTARAAKATRDAAIATKESVAAFVASQGPQIIVTAHGNPTSDLLGEPSRIEMKLENQGPTIARNLAYEWWIEVQPFDEALADDFAGFTAAASHYNCDHRVTVYPKQKPIIINVPLGRSMSENERSEIRHLKKRVCIRVRVTYRNTFSSLRQYADFGYWPQKDGLGFLSKYNDSGTEEKMEI